MSHPIKIGKMTTVDRETGEVTGVKHNALTMLPTKPGVCQECAVDHPHDEPHDCQSLTYQYRFYGTHGRWPTWTDAMQHCTPEVKKMWREGLLNLFAENGVPIPDDLREEKPTGR